MPPPKDAWNPIAGPGDFDVTETVHSDTYAAIEPSNVNLEGRTAFIVGGSRGIGRETVLSYARAGVTQLAVGARSDLSDLESEVHATAKECGKQAPKFLAIKVDVASRPSVEEARKVLETEFKRLDILVIVAATIGVSSKIADTDPDAWWSTIELNLRGPFLLQHSFIPLLLKTEGGLKTVCSVASVGAWIVSPTLSDYQISKTALVRLADFISAEYKDDGLISFSVHPGNVVTSIMGPDGPPKRLEHVFCDTTRLAGDTIVHLTKDRKEWVNGRYINVTWDMPQLEAQKSEIVKEDKFKTTMRI